MTESKLLGYARRTNGGSAIKISISETAFSKAPKYESLSGEKYVGMVIDLNKLRSLLCGEREVISVVTKGDDK